MLGLEVRLDEDSRLRFHDPVNGKDLLAHEEEAAARRATEARLGETEARLGEEGAAHRATRARLEEEIAARDARIAELEVRLEGAS